MFTPRQITMKGILVVVYYNETFREMKDENEVGFCIYTVVHKLINCVCSS